MTFEEQKRLCIRELEGIVRFGADIEKQSCNSGFIHPLAKIEELKKQLENANSPFLSRDEIENYLKPILIQIQVWNPQNKKQLAKFWNAYMEIGNKANEDPDGFLYNPRELVDENLKKIENVNHIFLYCHDKFQGNFKEQSFLYALFYAHILKTETLEYSMQEQLDYLLNKFKLSSKYDSNEIFSSFSKISKGKGFRTDARAIRDTLSHYQYDVDFSDPIRIKFHNHQKGYAFDKSFTKDEFVSYLQNTDSLYKSQLNLLRLWISTAVIDAIFKK